MLGAATFPQQGHPMAGSFVKVPGKGTCRREGFPWLIANGLVAGS